MTATAQQTTHDVDPAVRMCALTREQRERSALLRFVVSPDGEIVPDLKEKLPGRGVWLTLSRKALGDAIKRNTFARAMRADVNVPDGLEGTVARLLLNDALSALSLASKAGQAVAGFEKVETVLGSSKVGVLIAARDGAEDGRRKLAGKLRARGLTDQLVECFASADLDLALGRTNVIHAAITCGGLAQKFLACARRYESFEFNGAAKAES